jgi:lipopolysaccharide transport system ATP-binding protein
MLNGLVKPDKGRIEIRGRVGALIALGAGFNPILTGRENIYVNAAVLGLSKRETDRKLEEIVEFSGLQDFIDAPVQTYSSGMAVRLGFSVAAILVRPDVLFLDEVLAVGDIGFTIKCLNTVRSLTRDAAVVFVSHNMQYVSSFCDRVMVLDRGRALVQSEDPAVGIDHYFGLVEHATQVSGSGGAEVADAELVIDGQTLPIDEPTIPQGATAALRLTVRLDAECSKANLLVYVHDEAMTPLVCMPVLDVDRDLLSISTGHHRFEIPLGQIDLNAGKYSFVIGVRDAATSAILTRVQGLLPFRVLADTTHWGRIVRPAVLNISGASAEAL